VVRSSQLHNASQYGSFRWKGARESVVISATLKQDVLREKKLLPGAGEGAKEKLLYDQREKRKNKQEVK
jgi:hypothetical protein